MTTATFLKNVVTYAAGGFCAVMAIIALSAHEDAEREKIRKEAYAEGEDKGKWKVLDNIDRETRYHGEKRFEYIVKDQWSDELKQYKFVAKKISDK